MDTYLGFANKTTGSVKGSSKQKVFRKQELLDKPKICFSIAPLAKNSNMI